MSALFKKANKTKCKTVMRRRRWRRGSARRLAAVGLGGATLVRSVRNFVAAMQKIQRRGK